jgi:hypothetical protein
MGTARTIILLVIQNIKKQLKVEKLLPELPRIIKENLTKHTKMQIETNS